MPTRGRFAVEVRLVVDPEDRSAVLLQIPDGYVLMKPADARRVADALNETADEAEDP